MINAACMINSSMMHNAHNVAYSEDKMQETNLRALIKTAWYNLFFLGYIRFIDSLPTLTLKELICCIH